MVGQGVLRECLLDPDVESVLSVGRNATGKSDPKLREVVLPDPGELSSLAAELGQFDACFFSLGVSSFGMSEEDYRRITYDLTLRVARTLVATTEDVGRAMLAVAKRGSKPILEPADIRGLAKTPNA